MEEEKKPSSKTPIDEKKLASSEEKVDSPKDDSVTVAEIDWKKRYLDLHTEFEDHKKSSFRLIMLLLICATIIIPFALQMKMNVSAPILPARHLFDHNQTVYEEYDRGHIRFENREYDIRTTPAPPSYDYNLEDLRQDFEANAPAPFIE